MATKKAPKKLKTQAAVNQGPAKSKPSKLASLKAVLFGKSSKAAAQAPKKTAPKGKTPAKPAKAVAKPAPAKAAKGSPKSAPVKTAKPVKAAAPVKAQAKEKASAKVAKPAPAKVEAKPQTKKGDSGSHTVQVKATAPAKKTSTRASKAVDQEAVCREPGCEALATSAGNCRLHYIKNWKKIKRKEVILKEGKLNQYIEELVSKYPEKYIEAIRQDLANDKDFAKVIYDLDLDESIDDFEGEGESIDSIVGDIKRDFEDDSDTGF
jgi:hypothetical protein